ncbi:MAG TPA: alpha-L-arabinofuranosidase C-terminal domain-containing protein [Terriglobales bacterium]|nr:alpha-L-arabinofuranosidase C-terminal domain-containing protein [Terriglobales bacterium]
MERRQFLKAGLLASASALLSRATVFGAAADSHIEILVNEPIGTISPNIYGHFAEHLGGVIYDGIWVGEDSKIPNNNGIRTALAEALRKVHAPVIRWPGGCFADSYDWKDGIGPRNQRPRRTNFWAGAREAKQHKTGVQEFETNAFGTADFVRFCRLSGAEPYIAANIRSLPPLDFDHWVEYCNSPTGSTTLADQRARDGLRDPLNVRYWGVGNESWGCGGNFLPEDYATEFRRYTTWVPGYGVELAFVASGSNGDDLDWTHRFFEELLGRRRYFPQSWWGWSVHHYAENLARGRTMDWIARKGDALQFDPVDYYELLHEADRMESIVLGNWNTMGEFDHQHRIKLVVDEYGPWYKSGSEIDPTHLLGQQITMRDAIATALTLDTFNRHAEKVGMAACAQLINCLNSLFLAHQDRFIVTANYHVFQMYASHQSSQAVRAEFSSPEVAYDRDGKPAHFWGLKGSASVQNKNLVLTVVNPHLEQPRETEIAVRGANVNSGSATVLASSDIHAHNTFDQPDAVRTKEALPPEPRDGIIHFTFPPASVTRLTLALQ